MFPPPLDCVFCFIFLLSLPISILLKILEDPLKIIEINKFFLVNCIYTSHNFCLALIHPLYNKTNCDSIFNPYNYHRIMVGSGRFLCLEIIGLTVGRSLHYLIFNIK